MNAAPLLAALSLLDPVDGISATVILWIGLALCILAAIAVALLYTLLNRLSALESRTAALSHLSTIDARLSELVQEPADLDIRRVEHVLIDIRDGQRRVEARMLSVLEQLQTERAQPTAAGLLASGGARPISGPHLVDRVMSRLLALGFERVEFLTTAEEIAALADADGDVLVEARRGGVPYKGRVFLQEGGIADVQLRPSYQIFP